MKQTDYHTKLDVYAAFFLFVLCCLISFSEQAMELYESITFTAP